MYTHKKNILKIWLGAGLLAILLGMFLGFGVGSLPEVTLQRVLNSPKKKIVIFSCLGGGGHTAASQSISSLVGDTYDIKVMNLYDELLGNLDPVRGLSGGSMTGVDLYNKMLADGWTRTESFLVYYFGPLMFTLYAKSIRKTIYDYLVQENPDLVISVIPYGNYEISRATESFGIPFLLTTTDNDLTNWQYGLSKIKRDDFKVTIGFDLPSTRTLLERKGIKSSVIKTIGMPIRERFVDGRHYGDMRAKWNVPQDKFTVLLMMGGVGARMLVRYMKRLLRCQLPIHVLACVGKNEALKEEIESLRQPDQQVTFATVGFTQDVDELMKASDILITKTGPGTIQEAMFMKLPMILDRVGPLLYWEEANARLVGKNELGVPLYKLKDMEKILRPFVEDKEYYQRFKNNLEAFEVHDYRDSYKQIIIELLDQAEQKARQALEAEKNKVLKMVESSTEKSLDDRPVASNDTPAKPPYYIFPISLLGSATA